MIYFIKSSFLAHLPFPVMPTFETQYVFQFKNYAELDA